MRRSSAWSAARSVRSRSNVSSVEIEMRSASSSRSRGSRPRARSRSSRPTWPGSTARSSASERSARPPIVATPAAASRSSARGPTPGRMRVGSGARKRASRPGGTTVMPPGLRRSDATLHTTFDVETPSEHVSDVAPRTATCTASAIRRACANDPITEPRSRYPSSRPVRSTRGTTSATAAHTAWEYWRYSACRGRRNTTSGQRRSASAELIADRIPKRRAT